MSNKVNLSKAAEDLGVSISTVSRALSGKGRVSEETKNRVLDYLKNHELVMHQRREVGEDCHFGKIGLVIPYEEERRYSGYYQQLLNGVYRYLSSGGFEMVLIKSSPVHSEDLIRAVKGRNVDGLILTRKVDWEVEYLLREGMPFVVIGQSGRNDYMAIRCPMEKACYDITNTLFRSGILRTAVMCFGKENISHTEAFRGVMRAHMENYMVFDRTLLFYEMEEEAALEQALELCMSKHVDCILCLDDDVSMRVSKYICSMGLRIPEDIQLVSLRGSEVLDSWPIPISYIQFDLDGLARGAVEMLTGYLREGRIVQKILPGYELRLHE